jgi:hypothetical protein
MSPIAEVMVAFAPGLPLVANFGDSRCGAHAEFPTAAALAPAIAIDDAEVGAFGGQRPNNCAPNSARPTGNECHFAAEFTHNTELFVLRVLSSSARSGTEQLVHIRLEACEMVDRLVEGCNSVVMIAADIMRRSDSGRRR